MRKAGILTLGFVLVASTLALAAGPNQIAAGTRIQGVITAIDEDAQQIVLDGVTVVQADEDTVIQTRNDDGELVVVPFSYLAVDQTVRACGLLDGNVLDAWKITVRFGQR